MVKGPNHADPLGIRRPHREVDPAQAVGLAGMSAEILVNLVMVALGEQVAVLIAEDREVQRVGIDKGVTAAVSLWR